MLINFFMCLKQNGLPVSLTELFALLECLDENIVFGDVEDFYYLARLCMVKDEKHFDRFDRAFAEYFRRIESTGADMLVGRVPEEWLRKQFEASLSEEEKARLRSLGGLEQLLEEFRKRLAQQRERHQGGDKWIGTGGTSPFGAYGWNPAGIRLGRDAGGSGRAVKVWDRRDYRELDDSAEIGARNIKLALRKLRKFARAGAEQEFDLDGTVSSTARNGGLLDIKLAPERRNAVKVLLLFDVGGSMDPHVRLCEELFSAARSEFRHLEYYYFHNFLYESVWTKGRRRRAETESTLDLICKYPRDCKVIFVGDATMAPYEITHAGGSIEHYNEEPGAVWMRRMTDHFEHLVWLNPVSRDYWEHGYSIGLVRELVAGRMMPLTIEGLEQAMRALLRRAS